MNRWVRKITAGVALLGFAAAGTSCGDEPDTEVFFVGDSLVEFWDAGRSFPTLRFRNLGRAGAGIAYLGELGDRVAGREVVLLIGTNDAWQMVSDGVEDYADRYIAAARGLKAGKIYLFSVLPRTLTTDTEELREAIPLFNSVIRGRLVEFGCEVAYVDVYDRMRDGNSRGIRPELSPDGIHLNSYGYEILTEELWKKLK